MRGDEEINGDRSDRSEDNEEDISRKRKNIA